MRSLEEIKREIYIRSDDRLQERCRRRRRVVASAVSLCLFTGVFVSAWGLIPERSDKGGYVGSTDVDNDKLEFVLDAAEEDCATLVLYDAEEGTSVSLSADTADELIGKIESLEAEYAKEGDGFGCYASDETKVPEVVDPPEEPGYSDEPGIQNNTDAPCDTAYPGGELTIIPEKDPEGFDVEAESTVTGLPMVGYKIVYMAEDTEVRTLTLTGVVLTDETDGRIIFLDEQDAQTLRAVIIRLMENK